MKAETSICTFFHGFINAETSLILFCRSLWPAILGFFRNMLILGTPKKFFFFVWIDTCVHVYYWKSGPSAITFCNILCNTCNLSNLSFVVSQ